MRNSTRLVFFRHGPSHETTFASSALNTCSVIISYRLPRVRTHVLGLRVLGKGLRGFGGVLAISPEHILKLFQGLPDESAKLAQRHLASSGYIVISCGGLCSVLVGTSLLTAASLMFIVKLTRSPDSVELMKSVIENPATNLDRDLLKRLFSAGIPHEVVNIIHLIVTNSSIVVLVIKCVKLVTLFLSIYALFRAALRLFVRDSVLPGTRFGNRSLPPSRPPY